MAEYATLDRCAAYVAARTAVTMVQRIAARWPDSVAERLRHATVDAMQATADAVSHHHGSVNRRRCARQALTSAVRVAALVDLARAMSLGQRELDDLQRIAGRTIALLAMFLHAETSLGIDERDLCDRSTVR